MTLTAPSPTRANAYTQPVPYLPGLDGLRALAVIAVIVYHGNPSWLRGGFLGVEVFFVISGYLITMLLLSEHRRSGSVGLKNFWFRRARRLLPAVFALLFVVSVVSVLFVRDELARLKGDLVASLTYTMNWHLIVGETSYFDQFDRPPLLRHLWSLAVEEQFYLLWPLLLVGLLALFRKRPDRLFGAMLGLALVSAVLDGAPLPADRPVPQLLRHRHPHRRSAARLLPGRDLAPAPTGGRRPPGPSPLGVRSPAWPASWPWWRCASSRPSAAPSSTAADSCWSTWPPWP